MTLTFTICTDTDVETIHTLVQDTIKAVYPKYYPAEVVDFFSVHHSRENILHDIHENKVWVLCDDEICLGTGTVDGCHITRIFVHPKYQGCGYGKYIMNQLENIVSLEHSHVEIDSSLPAALFYEKLGYHTTTHGIIPVDNEKYLVYEIMKKNL